MEVLVNKKPHTKCIAGLSLAVPGYVYLGANSFKDRPVATMFSGELCFPFALLTDKASPSLQSPGVEGK